MSPDPNVFQHTNALAGLKPGGVFIMQSDRPSAEKAWQDIPRPFQKIILDKQIRVYCLDAFRIAREEASDPDLQLRMQGIAFQGAFFAASPVMQQAGLDEARLLTAIEDQLQHKFGGKGARVVADNLRVVKRGFDEIQELEPDAVSEETESDAHAGSGPPLPVMVERLPQSQAPITDVHRFWEQTGSFYARGMGSDNITDPFIGLGVMPASTALFRDMTQIRFEHPEWIPENCTACGNCYTVCPTSSSSARSSTSSGTSWAASPSRCRGPSTHCRRRKRPEPEACSPSPSIPTPARAAWSVWRSATTTRCGR
jgi:pyruvate-ferredoxin/flavodoxin oxidoreductase